MKIVKKINWDWTEQLNIEELAKKLKDFGVFVYDDPNYEGSDSMGLIFSNQELTKEELID